jgi:hypothetical protein
MDAAVPRLVCPDLVPPESAVVLGLSSVERATMPETAIDKDHDALFLENEVGPDMSRPSIGETARLNWHGGFELQVPPPADDAMRSKELGEGDFGPDVPARADAGHQA